MAQFDGKVSIREVERKAFEIQGDQSEAWIQALLHHSAPREEIVGMSEAQWVSQSKLNVVLRVEKVGGDYLVSGKFDGSVPAGCSRCGDPFMVPRASEFRVLLVPGNDPAQDVSDDPDYVFFYTDDIDLLDVISEQIIVLEPVAEAPAQKPDGSCVLCHKNPSFGAEKVEDFVGNTAFSKLKDLKIKN